METGAVQAAGQKKGTELIEFSEISSVPFFKFVTGLTYLSFSASRRASLSRNGTPSVIQRGAGVPRR